MLKTLINHLQQQQHLTPHHIRHLTEQVTQPHPPAHPEQLAAVLSLMNAKGITAAELHGFVSAAQSKMTTVNTPETVLDIVGTGGDGSNSFNISTASALLVSRLGVKVIKQGNYASSSHCGSSDVLPALGIALPRDSEAVLSLLDQTHFGYCHAPTFHPALRSVKALRRALSVPTIFNLMGPLINPARPECIMLGVSQPHLLPLYAECIQALHIPNALLFHGNGLDEITTLGPTTVIEIQANRQRHFTLDPADFGFDYARLEDLTGQDARYNAEHIHAALTGPSSPLQDTLVLNAGVALAFMNVTSSIEQGIKRARQAIKSGLVKQHLLRCQRLSHAINELTAPTKPNVLNTIINTTQHHLRPHSHPFRDALAKPGLSIIGEIKRKTPSKGVLATIESPLALAKEYVKHGIDAVSIITEEHYFNGSPHDLQRIANNNLSVPLLRKDFIVDRRQIIESVRLGAHAVLLIMAAVKDNAQSLFDFAQALGLEVLVETHTQEEIEHAVGLGATLISINNRNLTDFTTSIHTSLDLIQYVPDRILCVSASGIESAEQAQQLYNAGFDGILVGEALVTSPNRAATLAALNPEQPQKGVSA